MSQAALKASLESLREQPDRLIEIILRQAGVIEELRAEIQSLKDQIKDLNDRNDGLCAKVGALEQKAARQAAPFRIREQQRKADPQKPGRKAGHAGSCRPVPEVVEEQIVVPLRACPQCGQKVGPSRPVVQYLEELPLVRPRVIRLITQEAHCPGCRQTVRSTHPLQVSLARGAAGVQLGPRVVGLAATLNKQYGLTMRKSCAVLKSLFGLKLSPGGLTQALKRLAGKLEPAYEQLVARLRDGPCVHSDETSWWVEVVRAIGCGCLPIKPPPYIGWPRGGDVGCWPILWARLLAAYWSATAWPPTMTSIRCSKSVTAIILKPSARPWKTAPVPGWRNCAGSCRGLWA